LSSITLLREIDALDESNDADPNEAGVVADLQTLQGDGEPIVLDHSHVDSRYVSRIIAAPRGTNGHYWKLVDLDVLFDFANFARTEPISLPTYSSAFGPGRRWAGGSDASMSSG
jgi:hypothetical protein